MAKKTEVVTERTSAGLMEAMFQELDLLRNGQSNPHRASAVAKLAVQIIGVARLEVDVAGMDRKNIHSVALRSVPSLKLVAK